MNHDQRSHSAASCPAHLQLGESWGRSWGLLHRQSATEDEDRAGYEHWVQSLSRQWEGNNLLTNRLPISVAPLVFGCSSSLMALGIHIWTQHYFCGRLQIHFPINTSRTQLHFMLKCSVKAYIPNPSENTMGKIQHPNI